jgi:hypothetical protein
MPIATEPRVRALQSWLHMGLACVLSVLAIEPVFAQAATATAKTAKAAPAPAQVPTLQSMANAVHSQDYTAIQLRRFRDDRGVVTTVTEQLEVDANGTGSPDFRVSFLGVVGQLPGSPIHTAWQKAYSQVGPLFFTHGMFRVRNLAAALANYTTHDFGSVVRAGRSARRLVVFPNSVDKAIWLVDIDTQTNVLLYGAEFDVQLNLVAEVEVQNFLGSVTPWSAALSTSTPQASFTAADAFMGQPSGLVDPALSIVNDYQSESILVRDDPMNGRQSLVMTFTDGIDQFVVTQTPSVADPFAGLPSNVPGSSHVSRFRDKAMSVLAFWEGGVSFQVAGRGALVRLDGLAKSVLRQAIATN